MAPISPCQSGRRVIAGDRTAHLSSFLGCVRAYTFLCVVYLACLSGHCGRCGYFSISTIGLRSIASLPLLPPHHSVTPCHSPGSARSDDELLVPRLPAGILGYCDGVTQPIQASGRIKPLTCRQSSSQALCYMWVCVCAFVYVCNHVIYET